MQKRSLPLALKLAVGIVLLVSVLAAGLGFAWQARERATARLAKQNAASRVAVLFASYVSASVVFDDREGMKEALQKLAHDEEVISATIFALDEKPIERFERESNASSVEVSEPVLDPSAARVGRTVLRYSLAREEARHEEERYTLIFGVIAMSALLTLTLLALVNFVIVRRLERMSRAALRMSEGEQVTIGDTSADEIGQLAGSFDHMVHAIAEREGVIAARNADMRLVLDNVDQGLLVLDREACIGTECSAIFETWFGPAEVGTAFEQCLARVSPPMAEMFSLSWQALIDEFLPRSLLLEQMPRRLVSHGNHLDFTYRVIGAREDEPIAKVLVVMTNVTRIVEQQAAERRQRESLSLFKRIGQDKPAVVAFAREMQQIVASLGLIASDLPAFKRAIHTLKGNASLFGVESLAAFCHRLEDRMVDTGAAASLGELREIEETWAVVRRLIEELAPERTDTLEVGGADLSALASAIRGGEDSSHLLERVERMTLEPANKPLQRLGEHANALAERLGRAPIVFCIDGGDVRLPPLRFDELWAALVHVVRNSADHGFPSGMDRSPRLELSAKQQGSQLVIRIADNGVGIPWDRVRMRAHDAGLPCESQQDLVEALFADGVSTSEVVSDTSGRGVGMSAVRETVRHYRGSIKVESAAPFGTTWTIAVPLQAVARAA